MSANPITLLSDRLRPGIECAPWVIEEVRKLESVIATATPGQRGIKPVRWECARRNRFNGKWGEWGPCAEGTEALIRKDIEQGRTKDEWRFRTLYTLDDEA